MRYSADCGEFEQEAFGVRDCSAKRIAGTMNRAARKRERRGALTA